MSRVARKLPGRYFRTPAGHVARPMETRTPEAAAVAAARGVAVVYRLAWLMRIGDDVRELRGSALFTLDELLTIPRSRWTANAPRKVSGP